MQVCLFTLRGAAKRTGVAYGYLRKLLMGKKAGQPYDIKGLRFTRIGNGQRGVWLAHDPTVNLTIEGA